MKALSNPMISTIITSSLAFGILHVLTGPDHITALLALTSSKGRKTGLQLGVRWGCGHSGGVFLVFLIISAIRLISSKETKDDEDDEFLSSTLVASFELIAGIFMTLIGLHTIHKAQKPPSNHNSKSDGGEIDDDERSSSLSPASLTPRHTEAEESVQNLVDLDLESATQQHQNQPNRLKISQRMLSLMVGGLHGLAGSAGLLGVLPALQISSSNSIRDYGLSILYLILFSVSGIATMGIVGGFWGWFSFRIGRDKDDEDARRSDDESEGINLTSLGRRINIFSGSLSVIVGLGWCFLVLFVEGGTGAVFD